MDLKIPNAFAMKLCLFSLSLDEKIMFFVVTDDVLNENVWLIFDKNFTAHDNALFN